MAPHRDEMPDTTTRLAPGSPGDDVAWMREVEAKRKAELAGACSLTVLTDGSGRTFRAWCSNHGEVGKPHESADRSAAAQEAAKQSARDEFAVHEVMA